MSGHTPDDGWTHVVDPSNNLHTLIEVVTDEPLNGKTPTDVDPDGLAKFTNVRLS